MQENYQNIAPKFRSRKAFITAVGKSYEIELQDLIPANIKRVNDFLGAENDFFTCFMQARGGFSFLSRRALIRLMAQSLELNDLDKILYEKLVLQYFLTFQWDFYIKETLRIEYLTLDEPREVNPICVPYVLGDLICYVTVIGHEDLFSTVVKFCLDLFDKKLVDSYEVSITQFFVLQLSEQFLNLSPRNWLADDKNWAIDIFKKEPLFADLMVHWDDVDTEVLSSLLFQLLNRHTIQATRNNKDGGRDYIGLDVEQFPLEVLFIFRLRQWRGLNLPIIKHPLMEPPFHQLPDPIMDLIPDEQIVTLMKKVRSSFSDYDELLTKSRIRDWKIIF